MDDLISRVALLDEFRSLCGPQTGDGWDNMGVRNLIMRQKTVDAAPVVHGRWIDHKDEHQCSECKEITIVDFYVWKNMQFDYCPYCGAKMDGESNG